MSKEFIGDDGLKYCNECNKALQVKVTVPLVGERIVSCICECILSDNGNWVARQKEREIEINRRKCFLKQQVMYEWNFNNDDGNKSHLSSVMKKYVDNFPDYIKEGQGLILYGDTGTGKSFYAGCIANALLDEGYKAIMATTSSMIDEIQEAGFGKKAQFLQRLNEVSLLIVDDLGAEGNTEYRQSVVFDIIDSRYRSKLPMIITTNITASELKKPEDKQKKRIYDRILERCHPIEVDGVSRRREKLKATFSETRERLGI